MNISKPKVYTFHLKTLQYNLAQIQAAFCMPQAVQDNSIRISVHSTFPSNVSGPQHDSTDVHIWLISDFHLFPQICLACGPLVSKI